LENFPNSLAAPPQQLREKHSVSTLAPTSAGTSRPPTRDMMTGMGILSGSAIDEEYGDEKRAHAQSKSHIAAAVAVAVKDKEEDAGDDEDDEEERKFHHEPHPEDMQAVFRIRYAGDVRLELTAEILLDYPMPSFVGIPVKLNITGLTFDGVGVVAYIRKRVHFCFLSPEDALAAVGEGDSDDGEGEVEGAAPVYFRGGAGHEMGGEDRSASRSRAKGGRMGGLLQEIRVESEIGQREGAKQSLKNVGKVEKFVLEQVRRIFEEEFVYPSFWTFLV
jgi:distribution and morphology protein 12